MAIDYHKDRHIAQITINRPERMNCLNQADFDELDRVWLDFRDDDEMLVAILTGFGDKAFCSGADLDEYIPKMNTGEIPIMPTNPKFQKGSNCFKPVIAAVNGVCLAGGTEILLSTDIRIAVEHATFGFPEVKSGLFPVGSTVKLPSQVPYCAAMEILLLGDQITASDALRIGLINRIVTKDNLMKTAMTVAERLARNGPLAVRAIKESVIRSQNIPIEQAYYLEAFLAGRVFGSKDATEGPEAFLEKRRPQYENR